MRSLLSFFTATLPVENLTESVKATGDWKDSIDIGRMRFDEDFPPRRVGFLTEDSNRTSAAAFGG